MDWIVTFDIGSDSHRRAVNKILDQYGIRILYTVYQIAADTVLIGRIIEEIRPHVTIGDHLLALPRCADCRAAELGSSIEEIPRQGWITS